MTTVTERPAAFTGTPEQIITDIIGTYQARLTSYIAAHLARRDWQLAEDLAQDAFTHLWRYHVSQEVTIDARIWGLLTRIGRQMIHHHLRRMRSHEVAADFTDPATAGGRLAYSSPLDTPHLASLYVDLESAKAVLASAAGRYQVAARRLVGARRALGNSQRAEAVGRCEARVVEAESAVRLALEEFRLAAARVAGVRAEWDAAAGEQVALVSGVGAERVGV